MDIKISFIINRAVFEDDMNEESIVRDDIVKNLLGEKLLKNISELKIEKINETSN